MATDSPSSGPGLTVIEPGRGGRAIDALRSLWRGRELWAALTVAELKASVRGAALHYLWWLLEPLLLVAVYVFLVELVLDRAEPAYPLFLFCALLPWKALSNSLGHAVRVMRNSRGVLTRLSFERSALPAGQVTAQIVYLLVGSLVLLPLMRLYDRPLTPALLLLPVLALIQLILTLGLALMLAVTGARTSDLERVVDFALRVLFFASPALYSLDRVPAAWRPWLALNPLAGLFSAWRQVVLEGTLPAPESLLPALIGAGLSLWIGAAVFARHEAELAKIV